MHPTHWLISTQVVVSSVQGYFGLPQRAAYAASKHALHGYFDSLRAELQAETAARVSVTVCAGINQRARSFFTC